MGKAGKDQFFKIPEVLIVCLLSKGENKIIGIRAKARKKKSHVLLTPALRLGLLLGLHFTIGL